MFANTGVWMMALVGGFIMEHLTTSPVLVTLAAAMSPLAGICAVVFSGAAADSHATVAPSSCWRKSCCTASVAFLVIMSSTGNLTPATLLIGIAGMGVSNGTSSPSWWTTVASLVPPDVVPVALSVDSFQWNIGQVVGASPRRRGLARRRHDGVLCRLRLDHVPPGRLPDFVARSERPALVHTGWHGGREPSRRRLIRLAVLLEHTRAPGRGGSHGSLRDPGGFTGSTAAPFAAHFLHSTAFGYGLILALGGAGAMVAALLFPASRAVSTSTPSSRAPRWPMRSLSRLLSSGRRDGPPCLCCRSTGACWVWATVSLSSRPAR